MKKIPLISLVILLPAILFSAVTLWIIQDPIKYPLFVFEVILVITIVLQLNSRDIKKPVEWELLRVLKTGYTAEIILAGLAGYALFLDIINVDLVGPLGGWAFLVEILPVTLCNWFLLGYLLLKNLRGFDRLSKLEILVLSFLVSYVGSSVALLVFSPVPLVFRSKIILGSYLGLVLFSTYHTKKKKESRSTSSDRRPKSLENRADVLAILLIIAYYLYLFLAVCPTCTIMNATDSSRHFMSAVILNRTPNSYFENGMVTYILFHAFLASNYLVAGGPPVALFLNGLNPLNLLLPIVIYCVAKRFFGKYHSKIPVIAMLFWVFFNNFSYWAFISLKLESPDSSDSFFILNTAYRTYWGSIYTPQPVFFFSPLSISYLFFFGGLLLMKMDDLPRGSFILVFAILLFGMYATHIVEAIIFSGILLALAILFKNDRFKLQESVIGSLCGLGLGVMLLASINSVYFGASPLYPAILIALVVMGGLGFSLIWRKYILSRITIDKQSFPKLFYITITYCVIFLLLFCLAVFWYEDFDFREVFLIGIVPWYLYPILLGLPGILAAISIMRTDTPEKEKWFFTFFVIVLTLILLGDLISFVNLNFIYTNYWERRFPPIVFVFACILASIPVIYWNQKLSDLRLRSQVVKRGLQSTMISVIVVLGFTSTPIQWDYWFIYSRDSSDRPSEVESEALAQLLHIFKQDPHGFATAITPDSYERLAFAAPTYRIARMDLFHGTFYPDFPLALCNRYPGLSHLYVYMQHRDFGAAASNPTRFFWKHWLPRLPVVVTTSEVMVLNTTDVTPPILDAPINLILPFNGSDDPNQDWFWAYDIVSKSQLNYQPVFDVDPEAWNSTEMIFSFDPSAQGSLETPDHLVPFLNQVKRGARLVVLNTNGYGYFSGKYLNDSQGASHILSREISGIGGSIHLPVTYNFTRHSQKNSSLSVIAEYTRNEENSVFAIREQVGNGEVILVNVRPIIEILSHGYHRALFQCLGEIFVAVNTSYFTNHHSDSTIVGIFDDLRAVGEIQAHARSMFLAPTNTFALLTITTKNGETSIHQNCEAIKMNGYNAITMNSSEMLLQRGQGLYTVPTFSEGLSLTFTGTAPTIQFVENDIELEIDEVREITLQDSSPIELLSLDTSYRVTGNFNFTGFQHHSAFLGTRVMSGTVEFHTYVSESQISTLSLDLSHVIDQSESEYSDYTERPSNEILAQSLKITTPFLVICFTTQILWLRHKRKKEKSPVTDSRDYQPEK